LNFYSNSNSSEAYIRGCSYELMKAKI